MPAPRCCLLAYAAGAATSLAVALLLGGRVTAVLKRSFGAGEWVPPRPGRRGAAGGRRDRVRRRHEISDPGLDREHDRDRTEPDRPDPPAAKIHGDVGQASRVGGSKLPVEGTLPALSGASNG